MSQLPKGFGLRVVGRRGQITLPFAIREQLGISEGDYVLVRVINGVMTLTKFYGPAPEIIGDDGE
jgi:AbrB family looped-hinge helix DNA binding protein